MKYDVDKIENNTAPCDIEEHPQLGTCYTVKIKTDDEEKEQYQMRSQILENSAGRSS